MKWKLFIGGLLMLIIVLILLNRKQLFGHKQQKMVTFYFLDNATARANRDKFGLGTANLIAWYKSKAKVYSFSANFNKTIIAGNRKIGYIIGRKALEDNLLGSTDTSGFAYFYLSDYFARSISKELATLDLPGLEKKETDSFQKMLTGIQDKTGSCMVEFAKKEAWFNYDDTLHKKIAMQKEIEEEVKKAGLGGK
jgi:hypothetical protein